MAEEDAELHHQCIPRSSGTARVGSDDSSAHHSSTRRPKIRLRSRSHGLSDGSRGQDAPSLCGAGASARGHGVGAELVQNCIWGDLARRRSVDVALFLTGWSQMLASRACHGCSQASDLSRQSARQRHSGHLAFQWRLDPLLELAQRDLDFKSIDEGTQGKHGRTSSSSCIKRTTSTTST